MSEATERPDDADSAPRPATEPGHDGVTEPGPDAADGDRAAPADQRAEAADRPREGGAGVEVGPGAAGPRGAAGRKDEADPAGGTARGGAHRAAPDPNAWGQACAEDLEAERARRRAQYGPQPTSAAEEFRKLAEAVTNKLSSLQGPIAGAAAQTVVRQLIGQARSVVEPVIERHPDVFDHLATAGSELLAAARAAVAGQEQRWTREDDQAARTEAPEATPGREHGGGRDDMPPGSEHIDLD